MSVSIQSAIEVKDKVNWFFYGFVVSTILVGATTVQAWIYYTTNQDKWPLRTLVTALVFMDFALTFMNAEVIRFYLITNFGNVEVFTMFSPVLKVEILCSFVVIFVVNIFFASRVYKLQQAPAIVTLIVVATALGSVVAGLMLSVEMGIALVLATFSEILALTTISFSLHNSRTGYKQTDTVLKKLFTFFVSRGLVLAAAQIVGICVYFAGKHPLNWLTWNFISAKLYGITVLAMLASRSNLRKALGNSVSLSELSQSQQPTRTTRASTNVSLIQFTRREEIFYDNQLDSPVPKIALHSPTTDQFN
ncbi:hypothetical protein C8R42DRAFT_331830 [Lentinula raphanica]|nr:hypothetical protein C8R42DRAFT_331830 [Lentinula raphanica]